MLVLISLTQKQDKKTFKLFHSRERELMNKYKYVVSLWRRVSIHVFMQFAFYGYEVFVLLECFKWCVSYMFNSFRMLREKHDMGMPWDFCIP